MHFIWVLEMCVPSLWVPGSVSMCLMKELITMNNEMNSLLHTQ